MRRVRDYIHKDLSCVNENSSLRRVINTMKLHRISAIPVVDVMGNYIGCISEKDILNAAVPSYMKSIYNTSFMAHLDQITSNLQDILNEKAMQYVDNKYPYVRPDDSMSYAADLLYRTKLRMLPVLEGETLIGLITRIEILSASLNE